MFSLPQGPEPSQNTRPLQEWFAAIELSGLPGIKMISDAVSKKAKREGWKSKRVNRGSGGSGLVFHVSSLPIETQMHLGWLDPTGMVVPFDRTAAKDDPMDQIAEKIAALIRTAVPKIGIGITLAALQKVYGIEKVRKVVPCAPEIIWVGKSDGN